MFFCEPCRVTNQWPEAMAKSYGPCEECGTTGRCHEVPSSHPSWDAARDAMSKPPMSIQTRKPS